MSKQILISIVVCALFSSPSNAFVRNGANRATFQKERQAAPLKPITPGVCDQQLTKQHMLPGGATADFMCSSFAASSNMWISTIDSDIANIPTNEFAPIFLGGIVVMFGGLLSALIVGYILDSRNLYASVVADSYAQGADNEEFWKGLSGEEKKKAQALIDKLNAKKAAEEGGVAPPPAALVEDSPASAVSTVQEMTVVESSVPEKKSAPAELDMFSDYADSGKK